MIDVSKEQLISLADAASLLPCGRKGRSPNVKTVYSWTTNGCRGVVLESIQMAGRRGTSREAVVRFVSALTAAAGVGRPSRRSPPNEARNRALEAELDRLGVGVAMR